MFNSTLKQVFNDCQEEEIYINVKNYYIENDDDTSDFEDNKYIGTIYPPRSQKLDEIYNEILEEGSSELKYIYKPDHLRDKLKDIFSNIHSLQNLKIQILFA